MTIDEAIKHEEEIAIQQIERANALDNIPLFGMSEDDIEQIKECYKCSKEHEQFAEWLKELKAHREAFVKIKEEINSQNGGICDYFIVDRIEEIINEYRQKGDDVE